MKFSIFVIIILAFNSVKCKPAGYLSVSSASVYEASLSPIHLTPPESMAAKNSDLNERKKTFEEAQIFAPAPLVPFPIHNDDQQEPVTDHKEEAYPKQPAPQLTKEEIQNLNDIRAIAKQVGACAPENILKCELFKATDGVVCSSSTAGISCNTRLGTTCMKEAFDACFNFAQANGIFCSNGGCAQLM